MATTLSPDRIGQYTRRITEVFKTNSDKRTAHAKSRPILEELARDPAFLTAVFEKHLRTPECLNAKHYPVVSINVALNPYYSIEANCWIPLADGRSNLTTKAIHHHGNMLLTTVTAFGPGYEHWTFEKPVLVDAARELYYLGLVERAQHGEYHVAFVDAYVPHIPMFPPDTSITIALWSNQYRTTWKDRVKRIPLLKRNDRLLRKLAARIGLAKSLDLKIVEYFDFFPSEEGFKGMKERIEFERGPNEDYLYSLFHLLQKTGNESLTPLVRNRLTTENVHNANLVEQLLKKLDRGETIAGRLSKGHWDVPFANFTSDDILNCLARQGAKPTNGTVAHATTPSSPHP